MNASHIHNRTARLHGQERLLRKVHRSKKIDIEDLLPVLRREFLKGLEGHQPSIVNNHIKPGKAVHRRFHSACDLHVSAVKAKTKFGFELPCGTSSYQKLTRSA